MRHWERHLTRSKVALLLLINLVMLLGGKYTALLTMFKVEMFGDSLALAKAPKKKPFKHHVSRPHSEPRPPQLATGGKVKVSAARRGREALAHHVRRGETLSHIAESYGTSVDTLRRMNRLKDSRPLRVGQRLLIPQEGSPSIFQPKETSRTGARALFLSAQQHLEPHAASQDEGWQGFTWPVEGVLTSLYGGREAAMGGGWTGIHGGIDISVPSGTPVRAAQGGTVVFAGYNGAYGKVVKIDHLNGFSSLYAHNSRILVLVGQIVKGGQVISLSGSTGRSTGPHLHFEVHKDDWPVDPLPYLQ